MPKRGLTFVLLVAALSLCARCGERLGGAELPPPGADRRAAGSAPELPRLHVDLPANAMTPTRVLHAGDDLQSAIKDARPGDVIALQPGAVFKRITLLNKQGDGWITIQTAASDSVFPRAGTRVDPTKAPLMPIIESKSDPVIGTDEGAHHYRFIGIQIRPAAGEFVHNLIELGSGENSADALPHHIVFDRCYIHGDPQAGGRRGIALNSRYTTVIDSYVSDFKEVGADSQAIAGWNGLGPFLILNNYLEGAGENLLFGGADPSVKNLVPADIEIRQNHFAKPLSWRGSQWSVKNLLELKNAHRVLIDANTFEYNWQNAQNGFAILFTPRNQDGGAPWSMVQDVTFTNNIVRHSGSAVNISGSDDNHPSDQTRRIVLRNNLFEDIDGARWGGSGRLFQLLSGTADVVIDHNTGYQAGDFITAEGTPHSGFVYTSNVEPQNQYGVGGSDTYGNPIATLTRYFPGAVFAKNVIAGGNPNSYPPNNYFPSSMTGAHFEDAGADVANIQSAMAAPRERTRASKH